MKKYTVYEYEQEDFDAVRDNITADEAIEILDSLPRGWFPYSLPDWGVKVTERDFDNYRICCAISFAINAIRDNGEVEE